MFVIGSGACWQIYSFGQGFEYGGRPWSYWISQVVPDAVPLMDFPGFHLSDEGISGIQQVGTEDLQKLVQLIVRPKSGFKALILKWGNDDRVPNSIRHLMIPVRPKSYNPAMAILFFRALGPEANTTIPALTELLHVADDARWAAMALSGIGTDGIAALEKEFLLVNNGIVRANIMGQLYRETGLVEFIAKQLDQDLHASVRKHAARNLGVFPNNTDVAIPALVKALKDPDGSVRFTACESLEQLGNASASVVSALETALSDPNPQVRFNASRAIQAIERSKP